MTKLTRLTAKIFGETATATGDDPEIGQFGSALAGTYVGTTDVATIQNLSAWSNGFIDSVTPNTQFPPLPEMTGFGKVLSYQTAYTLQQGMPEWDSATTYYINNFCSYQGIIYKSITDSNLNNVPLNDTVNWEVYIAGDFANKDLSNLTDTGNIAMAHAPMPSAYYDELTIGASGTTYIAPADGWFFLGVLDKVTQDARLGLTYVSTAVGSTIIRGLAGASRRVILPCSKGDEVELTITGSLTSGSLRFIYAKGSESEYTPTP